MHLRPSSPRLILTLPLFLMSGCTPRADLAPVVLHNQRFSGFNQEMESSSRNWQLDEESTYQDAKQREISVVAAARSGERSKMSNFRSSLTPSHPQKAEYPSKRSNAPTEDRDGIQNGKPKNRSEKPAGRSQNTSINSNNKEKRTKKRLSPEPEVSTGKHSKQIKLKKKSDISIDNKNMLMLNFQWPLKGKIRKNFSQTDNRGIDIIGNHGQTVRAAEAGKVVYSGQGLIGFGNLLIIKHNDDYLSAYANNSSLIVKEGQQVRKGQDIAKLGAAVSKKAVLHFEIRKNGKSVNPLSLLPNR